MTTTTKRELNRGRWAVALVGYTGWRRTSAIGDGITRALTALVGRYQSQSEAVAEAARLNAEYGGEPMPGEFDRPEFDARPYRIEDYLSQQDERNGYRPCDRRIAENW